jgi:orotidine-5'-phosphate decarboxylase
MNDSPLILALDLETAAEARALVKSLGDTVSFFKIGLELYAAAGMDFARELKAQGHRVFLDLKLYDIGETVRRAVVQIARAGVDFLTVHASHAAMEAAISGRGESALKVLAVTVLTNVDDRDLERDGYSRSVSELVDLRVRNAIQAGIDGMVCSALEVAKVRVLAGPRAILVTPGVRSVGAAAGDQKRVATPGEALSRGANYVVIGRQVTRAKDARGEVLRILDEISALR